MYHGRKKLKTATRDILSNMRSKSLILLLYCIVNLPLPVFSAAKGSVTDPNVSFGPAGSFGYFDIYTSGGGNDIDSGILYGGGFIFEKMFSNRLGIHSGMQYQEVRLGFFNDDDEEDLFMRSYAVPLYLITSFNGTMFSLNLLTGFTFSHLVEVKFLKNPDTGDPEINLLQYMTQNQAALSAGLNLKFRIGRFTDFFIGSVGDFHITKMLNDRADSDNRNHFYNIRGITGVLFRTNLFPISENSQ
jgi:hypothetical protein